MDNIIRYLVYVKDKGILYLLRGWLSMEEVLEYVKDKLSIMSDLYTYIRIVDPLKKEVLAGNNEIQYKNMGHCYDFWKENKLCHNCIAIRTKLEKKSFVKIEFRNEEIFLVQAVPINYQGKVYVVEMLKNITHTGIIIESKNESAFEVQDIIKSMNEKLTIDELTGVYNRRFIEERLPTDIHQCQDNNISLSIIMADIDHFKKVNDTYGHSIGDLILKEFTGILRDSIRGKEDWIARYGGEEFLIVIKNMGPQDVLEKMEGIRARIEDHSFCTKLYDIKVTCSFGVTIVQDGEYDVEMIIGQADKALYDAKAKGRNKVALGGRS